MALEVLPIYESRRASIAMAEKLINSLPLDATGKAAIFAEIVREIDADPKAVQSQERLLEVISSQAQALLRASATQLRIESQTAPNLNSAPLALYTGKFDPPTRGHESFLRGLRSLGLSVITGPDNDRRDEQTGEWFTPLRMRRFIMQEFLDDVFHDDMQNQTIQLFPADLCGDTFPKRLSKARCRYGEDLAFACGTDTLVSIISRYPRAIASGSVICMTRLKQGQPVSAPHITRQFYCGLLAKTFKQMADILKYLFRGHPAEKKLDEYRELFDPIFEDAAAQSVLESIEPGLHEFLKRLKESGRFTGAPLRLREQITPLLQRCLFFAEMVADSYRLEKLRAHISYVSTDQVPNSSTRDRRLLGASGLTHVSQETLSRSAARAEISDEIGTGAQLAELCARGDWDNVNRWITTRAGGSPHEVALGLSQIVHPTSLRILAENGLLGIYSRQQVTGQFRVPQAILSQGQNIEGGLVIVHPQAYEDASPVDCWKLANACAGASFAFEPDDPEQSHSIAACVHQAMEIPEHPRQFQPSILVDNQGVIVGMLSAIRIPADHSIKYDWLSMGKEGDMSVVRGLNKVMTDRLASDLADANSDAEVIVIESPADDPHFTALHLLGGQGFYPCGLEPGMDPSHTIMKWMVQGVHPRELDQQQGDLYLPSQAVDLSTAVLKLFPLDSCRILRDTRGNLPSKETKTAPPRREVHSLQTTADEITFAFGAGQTFAIRPTLRAPLNMEDFQDDTTGEEMLETALSKISELFARGEFPRPYIKIDCPVDSPRMLRIQDLLIQKGFLPVRFIPKTRQRPPMLSYCKILGSPPMTTVQMPLSRISGLSAPVEAVFNSLQTLGDALAQGTDRRDSVEDVHIVEGRSTVRERELFRSILTVRGMWDAFPSLFGHLHEVTTMKTLLWRNPVAEEEGRKAFRLNEVAQGHGIDQVCMRRFVALHDAGKALWAGANRYITMGVAGENLPPTKKELSEEMAKFFISSQYPLPRGLTIEWAEFAPGFAAQIADVAFEWSDSGDQPKRKSDVDVTCAIIEDYVENDSTATAERKRDLAAAVQLYRSFSACEERLHELSTKEDVAAALYGDKDLFAFLIMEFIDNISRYEIPVQRLDLRDTINALDVKMSEVVSRYGCVPEIKNKIEHKFFVLKLVAEILCETELDKK